MRNDRRKRQKKKMLIKTAGEAIDELGGNAKVAQWLSVELGRPSAPSTISGWRERGISRNFAIHFFIELVERRGHRLAPQVFGLDSWDGVLMVAPDSRGRRKISRVA
jgi:hypothetical protein